MDATETVRAYYAALRAGEPLPPFFAEREDLVKVGITERLEGFDDVAAGLRDQTRTTADWTVDSRDLRVAERGDTAWFSDEVFLAWTEAGDRREYDSRWSGTLTRGGVAGGGVERDDDEWRIVGLHVSAPH